MNVEQFYRTFGQINELERKKIIHIYMLTVQSYAYLSHIEFGGAYSQASVIGL